MTRLSREIRFSASPVDASDAAARNSWAGWPASDALHPFVVMRAIVSGTPDPKSGYLCNIKLLDQLLRSTALSLLARPSSSRAPAEILRTLWPQISGAVPPPTILAGLDLCVSPYLTHAIRKESMAVIYLSQQFEFSAAHRLHCDELSAEKNRAIFGKCNNPNGHGHNYIVEVTLAAEPGPDGAVFSLPRFENAVKERVVDRFDHKHLNADTAEFQTLNPTVENIARVIYELLTPALPPLHSVKVWETPKTWAAYGPL